MEKELELVEEMISISKELFEYNKDKEGADNLKEHIQLWESIKSFLIELKQIKEAKPSEALEDLEFICKILNEKGIDVKWLFKKNYNTIKQALLKAQEQEKVLEIIFKKQVDMFNLKVAIDNNSLRLYNNTISNAFKHLRLTQEEFDLLKRWCEKCQK